MCKVILFVLLLKCPKTWMMIDCSSSNLQSELPFQDGVIYLKSI